MRRYKKIMLCGGIILFCLSEGIGLSWGQGAEEVTQSSFWTGNVTLAVLSWIGVALSLAGLIASIRAAQRAHNSENAALEAKNTTIQIVNYFNDMQYGASIDIILEKITYIERLCRDSSNEQLIFYVIGEVLKEIKRIQEKINEKNIDIIMHLRNVDVVFQNLSKRSEVDKSLILSEMCTVKNELISCSEKIKKIIEGKLYE